MNQYKLAALVAFCVTSIILALSFYTNFNPVIDDFWGNYYLSKTIELGKSHTLYNAFFPIGYSLALKWLDTGSYPAINAICFNLLLVYGLFLGMGTFSKALVFDNKTFFMGLLLMAIYPRLLTYFSSASADIGALVFFSLAVIAISKALKDRYAASCHYLLGGILFSFAAYWRYHAFVASIIILSALFSVFKERRRELLLTGILFLLSYIPQLVILFGGSDMAAGGVFAGFLYKLMYGVNWYRISEMTPPTSAYGVISSAPYLFVTQYLKQLIYLLLPLAVPAFICFRYARGFNRRLSLSWLLFTLVYSAVVALGDSERAILLALPISLIYAAYAITLLLKEYGRFRLARTVMQIVLTLFVITALYGDVNSVRHRKQTADRYKDVEKIAIANGVDHGFQVYTTDLALYFRSIDPYMPAYNGGWLRVGTFVADWLFEEPSLLSFDRFLSDCKEQGYVMIYLIDGSDQAAPFLEEVRSGNIRNHQLRLLKQYDDASLFKII